MALDRKKGMSRFVHGLWLRRWLTFRQRMNFLPLDAKENGDDFPNSCFFQNSFRVPCSTALGVRPASGNMTAANTETRFGEGLPGAMGRATEAAVRIDGENAKVISALNIGLATQLK